MWAGRAGPAVAWLAWQAMRGEGRASYRRPHPGSGSSGRPPGTSPMDDFTDLLTSDDAEAMLVASREQPVWLLKHSASCPISAMGQLAFAGVVGGPPRYRVVVQRARAVSNALADALGVRHETPQAILIDDGRAVTVLNHLQIRPGALRAATETLP